MLAESAIAATASWCPNAAGRSLLVAGTRAGAIDSSFDTASVLVVYNVDVVEPGGGLHAVRTVPVPDRFHALAWGRSEDGGGLGLIAGGLPDGSVALWDAAAVVSGGGDDDKKAQLWARKEHAGPGRGGGVQPQPATRAGHGRARRLARVGPQGPRRTSHVPAAREGVEAGRHLVPRVERQGRPHSRHVVVQRRHGRLGPAAAQARHHVQRPDPRAQLPLAGVVTDRNNPAHHRVRE
jgi:hypothetical protein